MITRIFSRDGHIVQTNQNMTPPPSAVPSAAHVVTDESPSIGVSVKREALEPAVKKRKVAPLKRKTKDAIDPLSSQPPNYILVIDNGGDALKYGLVTADKPFSIPNLTAKLKHQWTVMIGDEVTKIQPNQIENLTRSTERSHITNLGNQVLVWKRILDLLKVQVPLTSEASQVFGWKNNRQAVKDNALYYPQQMAVLLLMAPFTPRSTMESMFSIWFDDFQFGHVGFASSAIFGASDTPTQCSCVVDLGWSATFVVPTAGKRAIIEGIRRMPIGGRHLANLWKYYMSYRQWNLMDSEFILRDVHEQLSYVSMDFEGDMKLAQRLRSGTRPFDRAFVLPDFQNTFTGSVRLPAAVKQLGIETSKETFGDKEDKLVTDYKVMSRLHQGENVAENNEGEEQSGGEDEDDDAEVDSDDEDVEHRRLRIIRQRAEEERMKRESDEGEQLLEISVERFAIPEALFRPSDAGFPPDMAGLPHAIAQAILACPRHYQAALFASIHLVGGTSKLRNIRKRLEIELRSLAPTQYDVNISVDDSPIEQAWMRASKWAQETPFHSWSVSKEEYEISKKAPTGTKPWLKLYHNNGGYVI